MHYVRHPGLFAWEIILLWNLTCRAISCWWRSISSSEYRNSWVDLDLRLWKLGSVVLLVWSLKRTLWGVIFRIFTIVARFGYLHSWWDRNFILNLLYNVSWIVIVLFWFLESRLYSSLRLDWYWSSSFLLLRRRSLLETKLPGANTFELRHWKSTYSRCR